MLTIKRGISRFFFVFFVDAGATMNRAGRGASFIALSLPGVYAAAPKLRCTGICIRLVGGKFRSPFGQSHQLATPD